MIMDVICTYSISWKTVQYIGSVLTSLRLVRLASMNKILTSMVLVEIIREVTYEVRQGSVTCHDLTIYKQM